MNFPFFFKNTKCYIKTRALCALVGVGLSLDPEGKKDRLVCTGYWHSVLR